MGEEMIEAFDSRGRSIRIPRQEWIEKVLPGALAANWDDPDGLCDQIVLALRDGLAEHVTGAAERLLEIDDDGQRSAVILAIVQMKTSRLDDAETTLRESLEKHGESGIVLTNLAKVHYEKGDRDRAISALRYALKVDPNQDNAIQWWGALHHERGGEPAYLDAMHEIAREPESWRPQLWIARSALELGRIDEAMTLYRQVILLAPDAGDAFMMLSGDLGNAGHVRELVELVEPTYDAEVHGPLAGINLARAFHAMGRAGDARDMLHQLQRMNRPDLAELLGNLELDLVAPEGGSQVDDPMTVTVVRVSTPIWTYQMARPDWLLPPPAVDGPRIAFLAFADTTRKQVDGGSYLHERESDLGRLSRALPLFLAETLRLRTNADTQLLVPVADSAAPIVSGEPWDPTVILEKMEPSERPDLLVTGYFSIERRRSTVVLEVWDPVRCERIVMHKIRVGKGFTGCASAVNKVLEQLLAGRSGLAAPQNRSPIEPPPEAIQDEYLAALGQLLVQVLAASGAVDATSIWNERGMFEYYFHLAERMPDSSVPGIMAICALACAAEYDSPVLEQAKVAIRDMLEREANPASPLARLAPLVWRYLGDVEAFESACLRVGPAAGDEYQAWIQRLRAA